MHVTMAKMNALIYASWGTPMHARARLQRDLAMQFMHAACNALTGESQYTTCMKMCDATWTTEARIFENRLIASCVRNPCSGCVRFCMILRLRNKHTLVLSQAP